MRAMETGVEMVGLVGYDVNLDIEALSGYSGQGKCTKLSWNRSGRCDTTAMEDLLTCAQSRNWQVNEGRFENMCIRWTSEYKRTKQGERS